MEHHHLQMNGGWRHRLSSTAADVAPGLVSNRASVSGSKRIIDGREEETDPLILFLATVWRTACGSWSYSMGKRKTMRPHRIGKSLQCYSVPQWSKPDPPCSIPAWVSYLPLASEHQYEDHIVGSLLYGMAVNLMITKNIYSRPIYIW